MADDELVLKENERLVLKDEFVLKNGTRVTNYLVDNEHTVTDPEGVAKCRAEMERVAANIFARAEIEKGA